MVSLCARWVRLGTPGVESWALEFFPRQNALHVQTSDRAWIIPRKFTVELARLGEPGGRAGTWA